MFRHVRGFVALTFLEDVFTPRLSQTETSAEHDLGVCTAQQSIHTDT